MGVTCDARAHGTGLTLIAGTPALRRSPLSPGHVNIRLAAGVTRWHAPHASAPCCDVRQNSN
jgi:hypothetical protein